jgi:hypothetical protein
MDLALVQLPEKERGDAPRRSWPICPTWVGVLDRVPAHETVKVAIETNPAQAWRAAIDGDGRQREGAQVAELTAWMPTPGPGDPTRPQDWPADMRVIARQERPHPGA